MPPSVPGYASFPATRPCATEGESTKPGSMVQRWVRRLVGPLFGKDNPLSEQRLNDPYPVFREMRESDPVYRSPVLRI